ncbi:hypothetical protein FA10DRAFT_267644 [Acaromyces ingoldii]|uniref:Uncharacterized protein n=1 Tax=Acaromyces ingoldii TaxID=215250 RepID=A0A316YJQ9_9BASI|nr:hypothetical protein FA10DRAFT_267644 [Acaromyces ingoldii]PWN89044.1 hypothetical protein FA10DRAFT_267644 [Acaromyces ingoldii]
MRIALLIVLATSFLFLLTSAVPVGPSHDHPGASFDHSDTSSDHSDTSSDHSDSSSGHSDSSFDHSDTGSDYYETIPYAWDTRLDTLNSLNDDLQQDYGQLFNDLRRKHYFALRIMWHHFYEYEDCVKQEAPNEAGEERTKSEKAYQKVERFRKKLYAEAKRLFVELSQQCKSATSSAERQSLGIRKRIIGWQVFFHERKEYNPFA